MADCSECGKPFTRYDNMLRHKMCTHPHSFEKSDDVKDGEIVNEEEAESDDEAGETDNGSESDDESTDEETEADDDDEEEDDEEDAQDDDEDDEDDENKDDAQTYNLWKYLHTVAVKDPGISSLWEDARERLASPELSDEELDEQAWSVVRPKILKHIYIHYANFLKLWHFANKDKTHKKIMTTKRKLINEEDYDPVEAIEQAVKKRKFLIMKATGLLGDNIAENVPAPSFDDEEEEEEDEEEEEEEEDEASGEKEEVPYNESYRTARGLYSRKGPSSFL